MRLDKFLKISRLVKRRTVANELCNGGHVQINGKTAKPSAEIVVGDTLKLRFGNRVVVAQILEVPNKAPSVQDAGRLYHLLSQTTAESML
ncbi:MAG: RNA-binding S4 domain-containing protein [Vampirovibrionales bacterium]|nr:RNA-binding S4 domain-containing protein [Vampirovibrionales bacterium]